MNRTEKYGTRSIAWSIFHRSLPPPARMIDMDYIECCQYCKTPLIIGELAVDIGQTFKATTILLNLAKRAKIPGILIFYDEKTILNKIKEVIKTENLTKIPTLTEDELKYLWREFTEIPHPILRIVQIYPHKLPEKYLTAKSYFDFLEKVHQEHETNCSISKQKMPMLVGR